MGKPAKEFTKKAKSSGQKAKARAKQASKDSKYSKNLVACYYLGRF